jgi:hypothetical protein
MNMPLRVVSNPFLTLVVIVHTLCLIGLAQDVPPPKPKPASPSTPQKLSPTQRSSYGIVVKVDMDCMISVDGADSVLVHAGKAHRFNSGPGQHLVQAESLDGNGSIEQTADQKDPQVVVEMNLAASMAAQAEQKRQQQRQAQEQQLQAQAREEQQRRQALAAEEEQRRKTQAIQAELDKLVGHWTRTSYGFTTILDLSKGTGNSLVGSLTRGFRVGDSGVRNLSVYYSVVVAPRENASEDDDLEVSCKYKQCTGNYCEYKLNDKVDHDGTLIIKSYVLIELSGLRDDMRNESLERR